MSFIHIQCIFRLPSSYSSWLVVIVGYHHPPQLNSSCFCCTSRSSNSVSSFIILNWNTLYCAGGDYHHLLPLLVVVSLATWSLLFWGLQIIFASSFEKYKIVANDLLYSTTKRQHQQRLHSVRRWVSDGDDVHVNLVQQYDCEACGHSLWL